jgi:hypothetical protein
VELPAASVAWMWPLWERQLLTGASGLLRAVQVQAADGAGVVGGHPRVDALPVEGVLAGQLPQLVASFVLAQADGARVHRRGLAEAACRARGLVSRATRLLGQQEAVGGILGAPQQRVC